MTPQSPIKLSCIIDDDTVYVNLIKKIIDIKNLSENLIIFKNGKEALDYFKAILSEKTQDIFPEIILLDLNMPVMDGWNLLKELTAIKPSESLQTTIYIVSSSIDKNEIERAKDFDLVTDYLVKPVEIDKLESIFNKHTLVA